jgi:peptidoglycan hydrolase-like protein with peptidoglycan-binding domain
MSHKTQYGETPTIIARNFGVSMPALIAANPHKPTTMVDGKRTWQSLGVGEQLNVPVGVGSLGAIAPADPAAPHAMIRQGSSGADVALWQTIIGTTPDGQFGPNTAAATRSWQSSHGLSADGVVGPMTWAAALGGAFPQGASSPVQAPSGGNVPAAVQALSSFDPCDPSNAALVCQAQSALGITADGKYGVDTQHAARRLLPTAPAGCNPRPGWWLPRGQSNCGGQQATTPVPVQVAAPQQTTPVQTTPVQQQTTPGGSTPSQGSLVPPVPSKGLSTGAIVAGALGAAALVGVVSLAAMAKKPRRAGTHKSEHKKKTTHKGHKKTAHKKKHK